jgi:hemerythrin
MAYLEWQDSFSVNVREIDEQHKVLVGMINTLHEAILEHKGRDANRAIINDMVNYALVHFDTEEKYMRKYDFPEYPVHKLQHDKFRSKALDLQKRMENDVFILTLEILTFLKDWLQNHILETDQRYGEFFNNHGLY